MNTKLTAALWSLPLLSGCMMAGIAGLGHPMTGGTHVEDASTASSDRLIVKELVADGIRVTAEFPSFAPTDSLTYTVTLQDLGGRAITSEASLFLTVSPTKVAHDATRVAPALRGGGTFIFKPSIPRDGSYRLTVIVERVGENAMEPPLTLEQEVQLSAGSEPAADAGHARARASLTPLVLLGGGMMVLMMIFAVR